MTKKNATLRNLADRDPEEAVAYMEKHRGELVLGKAAEEILRDLGKARKEINILQSPAGVEAIPDKAQRQEMVRKLQEFTNTRAAALGQVQTALRKQGYDVD
jgi:G:T/U-mismatch repair DNA glycosylase